MVMIYFDSFWGILWVKKKNAVVTLSAEVILFLNEYKKYYRLEGLQNSENWASGLLDSYKSGFRSEV